MNEGITAANKRILEFIPNGFTRYADTHPAYKKTFNLNSANREYQQNAISPSRHRAILKLLNRAAPDE